MKKVFIYWDNSNIFISAQEAAAELEGEATRSRVRIHFRNLLALAHAGRPIERAIAVGSIPPELRQVWNRLENEDVKVNLLERGALHGSEEGVDQNLQTFMLRDAVDYNGTPGIAILLMGDGSGFADGVGFHVVARSHFSLLTEGSWGQGGLPTGYTDRHRGLFLRVLGGTDR